MSEIYTTRVAQNFLLWASGPKKSFKLAQNSLRAGVNAVISDAGYTAHEQIMSGLWADYERVVIPIKNRLEST